MQYEPLLGQPRRGSRRAGRRAPGGRTMKLLAAMVYVFAAAALFLGDANWRDRRGCPEPWYVQVPRAALWPVYVALRSEEHTSELQSLMRISYAVFCLKKKKYNTTTNNYIHQSDNY